MSLDTAFPVTQCGDHDSELRDAHVRWADATHASSITAIQPATEPATPPASSFSHDRGTTKLELGHRPDDVPHRQRFHHGGDRRLELDERWEEKLVAALQSAMRRTAAGARASMTSLSGRVKQQRADDVEFTPKDKQEDVGMELLPRVRPGPRIGKLVAAPAGAKEYRPSSITTVVLCDADRMDGTSSSPPYKAKPGGYSSSERASRTSSLLSSTSQPTHSASRPVGPGSTKKERGWKLGCLLGLLILLLLAVLVNLVVLNVKMPNSSDRSQTPTYNDTERPLNTTSSFTPSSKAEESQTQNQSTTATTSTAPLTAPTISPVNPSSAATTTTAAAAAAPATAPATPVPAPITYVLAPQPASTASPSPPPAMTFTPATNAAAT